MTYEAFYDKCQSLPDNEKQWVNAFYGTIIEVFDNDNPQYSNPERICRLFYGKSSSLSKAQYHRRRNLVILFYEWLYSNEKVSKETVDYVKSLPLGGVISDYELAKHYFKDIQEVVNFINFVGSDYGLGGEEDLLNLKAMVVLAWHGVDATQMLKIHKRDLEPKDSSVTVDGNKVVLDADSFRIVLKYSQIDVHSGFPSRKPQVYLPSTYLFRSARIAKADSNSIRHTIRRFNVVAAKYGRQISLLNIRRNGLFNRIYHAGDTMLVSAIQEMLGCDAAFASGYKEFYKRWKSTIMEGE